MSWTFVYLMLFLKLPIAGLLLLVWWAIHQNDEDPAPAGDGDGGSKLPRPPQHPRPPLPRRPRRGPHGAPAPAAPARTRTVIARARRVQH
ncbi:MAG: hypothetical protein NVSMB51_08830 [Solirubrobacteraceae bacterium]